MVVDGIKFYSSEYSRTKKRICHCVLYSDVSTGLVRYFAYVTEQNRVYAIITRLEKNESWLSDYRAGCHFVPVLISSSTDVSLVRDFKSTLVFIQIENNNKAVVVKLANKHDHAVFK